MRGAGNYLKLFQQGILGQEWILAIQVLNLL